MDKTLHIVLQHGYLVLAGWVFAEQFGFPISSIPILLAAGALAGSGNMMLATVVICPVAGSMVADTIWYEIGRPKGSAAARDDKVEPVAGRGCAASGFWRLNTVFPSMNVHTQDGAS